MMDYKNDEDEFKENNRSNYNAAGECRMRKSK